MASYEQVFHPGGPDHPEDGGPDPEGARNWDYGYEQAVQGIRKISLRDIAGFARVGLRVGRRGLQLMKEQFPAAIYIKVGFDAGFLRYAYFLAEKPGND